MEHPPSGWVRGSLLVNRRGAEAVAQFALDCRAGASPALDNRGGRPTISAQIEPRLAQRVARSSSCVNGAPARHLMMKRIVLLLLASTAFGGYLRAANLAGADDFNDNSKDPTKWGTDLGISGQPPLGALTETNGRLEYTTTYFGGGFLRRPWILSQGSYTESWAVQLDTTINYVSLADIEFAMEVQKAGTLDQYRMGILHERAQSAWDYYSFELGSSPTSGTTLPAAFTGSIRIAFDAGTKVLTSYYDTDGPANGYVWTQAASFGIAGSGGQTGTDNWGMGDGDHFQIYVQGSSGGRVPAGYVYADNFLAVPEPGVVGLLLGAAALLGRRRHRNVRE